MYTVIDGEWTTTIVDPSTGKQDGRPHQPTNKLVSWGFETSKGDKGYYFFNHKEINKAIPWCELGVLLDQKIYLQHILDNTKLLIGHNLKADLQWLYASGLTYDGEIWDTFIYEYMKAKGMKKPLNLRAVLLERGLPEKLDIFDKYPGVPVDELPIEELREYGERDVSSTMALFKLQIKEFKSQYQVFKPALKLMNQFCKCLTDVESNGIEIDLVKLDEVENEFRKEQVILYDKLKEIGQRVMGHTPININSNDDLSQIIYSRKVKDKAVWKELFNLGTEVRNGVNKKKYIKKYKPAEFQDIIKKYTEIVHRTKAEQCATCKGTGRIQLLKKNGEPRKNTNLCKDCDNTGFIYHKLNQIAGLNVRPISSEYAAAAGFSTDKTTIEELLVTDISDEAKEFLTALARYNALCTYLDSFIANIRKYTVDNKLYMSYNQCNTATGRLSSTFHNLPRGNTFPVKKVVISRWEDGLIINVDESQLEFRVAALLAQDKTAINDILNKIDVHTQTAKIIYGSADGKFRQEAKAHTFKPLYGGVSGTDAEKAYYQFFLRKYHGIATWQDELCDDAIACKEIIIPSGRIYAFPYAKRTKWGGCNLKTQISNYPVQGFATGDIVPLAMLLIWQRFKAEGLISKLIMTVHDSIVVDCHISEKDKVINILQEELNRLPQMVSEWFNMEVNVPLEYELSVGKDWMNQEKVKLNASAI